MADFSDFTRIITKTQSSALIVQNRTPPALHILPPGFIKVKLNQDNKETSGDYLHTGGWMIVHAYLFKYLEITHAKLMLWI